MRDSEAAVDDLVSALIRRLPRAVIPLADLAGDLRISQVDVRRLAKLAEAEDRAIYWPASKGAILSVREASQLGRELRSSSSDSDVDSSVWYWTKSSAPEVLRYAEKFRLDRGVGGDAPTVLDGLTTTDCHIEEDDPRIKKWLDKLLQPARGSLSARWRNRTEDLTVGQIVMAGGMPNIKPIGLGLAWSPSIEITHNPKCSVCRGRKLGFLEFCLGCCRAGLDGILPNVAGPEKAKPAYVPDPDGLSGGVGKVA